MMYGETSGADQTQDVTMVVDEETDTSLNSVVYAEFESKCIFRSGWKVRKNSWSGIQRSQWKRNDGAKAISTLTSIINVNVFKLALAILASAKKWQPFEGGVIVLL